MDVRLVELATAELPCRTRLPFRFGAVTVTGAPLLHLRARIESADGRSAVGMASDLLVPKWFRKDLDRSEQADQDGLRQSARDAGRRFLAQGCRPVFAQWLAVHRELVESPAATAPGLLETGFGVALVERALLDATCRLARTSFWAALQRDLFRRQPLPPDAGPWTGPTTGLPAAPRRRIEVRHTVGRLDPLRRDEVPAAARQDDGEPEALDEVLARHGVRWLKVKIGGGAAADAARLAAIGALLRETGREHVQVTLDGNEQFADFAALAEVWRLAAADPDGRALLARVRWVEQPLPRAAAGCQDGGAQDPRHWPHAPLVLDEGDGQLGTFATSGYRGVSVKNCKGVFRALANRSAALAAPGRFQTSEDLTNLPVLALQQDLCTAGVLDLPHTERNGHHYFRGLDHLPTAVAEAALEAHPDLYARRADGGVRLAIQDGALALDSLFGRGYGADQLVVDALDRALDWQPLD